MGNNPKNKFKISKPNSNKIALHFPDKKVTYEELAGKIKKYSQNLSLLGFKSGDAVAILGDRGDDVIYMILSCLELGIIGVVISFDDCNLAKDILKNGCVKAVFVEKKYKSSFQKSIDATNVIDDWLMCTSNTYNNNLVHDACWMFLTSGKRLPNSRLVAM